jgi:hypothetical protein
MHSVLVQDFVSSQACYKSQYHYKYTHYMHSLDKLITYSASEQDFVWGFTCCVS